MYTLLNAFIVQSFFDSVHFHEYFFLRNIKIIYVHELVYQVLYSSKYTNETFVLCITGKLSIFFFDAYYDNVM